MKKKILSIVVNVCLLFSLSVKGECPQSCLNTSVDSSNENEYVVYHHEAHLHFYGKDVATLELTFPTSGYTCYAVYFQNEQVSNFTSTGSRVFITVTRSSVSNELATGNPASAYVYLNGLQVSYDVYCYHN